MKKNLLITIAVVSGMSAFAETPVYPSAWSLYDTNFLADRTLFFDYFAKGECLPILWGFDTAWNDYGNMLRGIRHSGTDAVGVVRVSFQPWAEITEKGVLPDLLQRNLDARLANVALIGKKVDVALNLDGGERTVKEVYGGLDADNNYIGDKDKVADAYARLIDATAAAVEKAGYRVVSAAPFNEPDYFWNGTPVDVFGKINERLKNFEEYPRFRDIRISGGNTLNCDQALPWYSELKDNLDEGNTHQLAGDFNHYADFFTTVRNDGKYATADELHNVMEAMVGVEYGMQTGIWWGSAEQARGEFMKASSGVRLGYSENRKAWSAASVYRAPSGKVQAFLGCSERQAMPSSYRLVSLDGDVYIDGAGPYREYVAHIPGDPNGAYQTQLQRNAETVLSITRGEDIQPLIAGDYVIVNGASHKVISGKNGGTANGNDIVQRAFNSGSDQTWSVNKVPEDIGGDYSYYFIRNAVNGQSLDDLNWNIEAGGKIIAYGFSGQGVQQWALEYDGDGWFHIRNKQSALYLESDGGDSAPVLQHERTDNPNQKWRFVRKGAPIEFDAPDAPSGLTAKGAGASITLEWNALEEQGKVTYTVMRSESAGKGYNTIARGVETAGFIDNTVEGRKVYSYKVVAEDASGNRSEASEAVEGSMEGYDIMARYSFNDMADDMTGNGFSLRFAADPSYRTGHEDGVKALYFRGAQYAQLPYSLLKGDEMTVATWVRPGNSTDALRIFSAGIDDNEVCYLTPSTNGMMRFVSVCGDMEKEISVPEISGWNHVAVTFEKDETVALFLNGECVGKDNFAGALPERRLLSYIGKGSDEDSTHFIGYISEFQVFNHALTPEAVRQVMTGEYSGVDEIECGPADVARTEYYSTQGMRLDSPLENGITIVRTVYTDGKVRISKCMNSIKQ